MQGKEPGSNWKLPLHSAAGCGLGFGIGLAIGLAFGFAFGFAIGLAIGGNIEYILRGFIGLVYGLAIGCFIGLVLGCFELAVVLKDKRMAFYLSLKDTTWLAVFAILCASWFIFGALIVASGGGGVAGSVIGGFTGFAFGLAIGGIVLESALHERKILYLSHAGAIGFAIGFAIASRVDHPQTSTRDLRSHSHASASSRAEDPYTL